MMKVFDVETRGGLTTKTWIDEVGNIVEEKIQDTTPILEANKAALSNYERVDSGEHFVRAASVPMIIYLQWLDEGVDMHNPDHADEVNRRLNSSEWAHLRTAPGRI